MAESKRQSIVGKIATPKIAPTHTSAHPLPSSPDALVKLIGARVKMSTAAPHSQAYEGTVFTACPILNIVALNTEHSLGTGQPATADKSSNGKGGFPNIQPAIGRVDLRQLSAREESRVNKLKEEERHRGKGVTSEAQAIYDSFKRINIPIRWHNQEMIVHDAVIISPPYRVEDCKGAKDKQEALNRVRKILEGERKKLQLHQQPEQSSVAPAVAVPTGTMRKGG